MMYALTTAQGRTISLHPNSLEKIPSGMKMIEISDENGAAIIDGLKQKPVKFYAVLDDGSLTDYAAKIEQDKVATIANLPIDQKKQFLYEGEIRKGFKIGGVTYGIRDYDLARWTQALTALDNAAALNAFNPATTIVQTVLGPVLDINGNPVPDMTVIQFRTVMAQLAIAVGQIRATISQAQ